MTESLKHSVQHLAEQHCFIVQLQQQQARLEYQLNAAQQRVNFTHTFVPVALRGQGIAELLVQHGLAWARAQSFSIMASCSYVQRFLDQ